VSKTTPTTLRITLVPVTRTDVLCLVCNNFGAQKAVLLADGEADAGIHDACVSEIKRGRARTTDDGGSGESESWPGRPGPGGP